MAEPRGKKRAVQRGEGSNERRAPRETETVETTGRRGVARDLDACLELDWEDLFPATLEKVIQGKDLVAARLLAEPERDLSTVEHNRGLEQPDAAKPAAQA